MFPEIEENKKEVYTILKLESDRYASTRQRMNDIASTIRKNNKQLTVDDLIRLYESDGITPDFLKEVNVITEIPSNFYVKLSELHNINQKSLYPQSIEGLEGLPPTRLLYYEDSSIREFHAQIIKIIKETYVILDQTSFYPRGGGQEPDKGTIGNAKVSEVIKQGDIVLHRIEDLSSLSEGLMVKCKVDDTRRNSITKHHTATHILNSSARNTLGSWVWQNSAFKDINYGRLDITHHSALNKEEVDRIEKTANEIVMKNLNVNIQEYERGESEQKFSFRIYQGGVVPSNKVRIVNISEFDIEACGGTHVNRTGELGLVKILKSERIQDGVVRLEFVAGQAAINYIKNQDKNISFITQSLGSSKEKLTDSFKKYLDDSEKLRTKIKILLRKTSPILAKFISNNSKQISLEGVKLFTTFDDELDEEFHITIGEKTIELDPLLMYVSLVSKEEGIRVIVFVGEIARKYGFNAGKIAKIISTNLGGSGGGDPKFGQGGGRFKNRIEEVLNLAELYVNETIKR
jgi:alanyl-tRNA synthetase